MGFGKATWYSGWLGDLIGLGSHRKNEIFPLYLFSIAITFIEIINKEKVKGFYFYTFLNPFHYLFFKKYVIIFLSVFIWY